MDTHRNPDAPDPLAIDALTASELDERISDAVAAMKALGPRKCNLHEDCDEVDEVCRTSTFATGRIAFHCSEPNCGSCAYVLRGRLL